MLFFVESKASLQDLTAAQANTRLQILKVGRLSEVSQNLDGSLNSFAALVCRENIESTIAEKMSHCSSIQGDCIIHNAIIFLEHALHKGNGVAPGVGGVVDYITEHDDTLNLNWFLKAWIFSLLEKTEHFGLGECCQNLVTFDKGSQHAPENHDQIFVGILIQIEQSHSPVLGHSKETRRPRMWLGFLEIDQLSVCMPCVISNFFPYSKHIFSGAFENMKIDLSYVQPGARNIQKRVIPIRHIDNIVDGFLVIFHLSL
mmetsp:Transcript_3271/g.12480  ORF Transcript_3271/g.12480 Transcript_3271/m.12480 type:complete len:258 (-) Transcript_3271:301-1074(-)